MSDKNITCPKCGEEVTPAVGLGPGGHYVEIEHCGQRAIEYDGCGGQCDGSNWYAPTLHIAITRWRLL